MPSHEPLNAHGLPLTLPCCRSLTARCTQSHAGLNEVPTLLDPVPGQGDMWAMMVADDLIMQCCDHVPQRALKPLSNPYCHASLLMDQRSSP